MSKPRRYAEGTTVAVGKTKDELERLLSRHGATQTLMGMDAPRSRILLGFSLGGRQFRLHASTARRDKHSRVDPEQLQREAWRAMLLIVKAKLEIAASGQSTVEQEFLANIVLPNGQTVADDVLPKIQDAYERGSMPLLLPG